MHTVQQLLFAQHFPFSKEAKKIILDTKISLEDLPESVVERAELMVQHAFLGKKYACDVRSSDLLLQELLAFPVAKILVSFANNPGLNARFASMVADSAYEFMSKEKDSEKIAVSLATDLGLDLDFPEQKAFFISLPLQEFLSVRFRDDSLKLVNQFVSKGNVLLDENGFLRFLKEKSYSLVFSSLPVPVKGLPKRLENIAKALKDASKKREQKIFNEAFKGKVAPEAFPPCVSQMYSQLASGQKLPHMANFTLATFLASIGMPNPQMLALFKKSPNFSERVASYQLDRIIKQKYAPPSCDKIKAYGYCPDSNCRVKHPLSFYRRKLRQKQPAKKEKDEVKK